MTGYEVAAQLMRAHMHDAATFVLDLLAEKAEAGPLHQACAFELKFLSDQLREGYPARATKTSDDGDERPLVWERSKASPSEFVVVRRVPRLDSLLKGDLPSLRAFQERRTP